MRPPSLSELTHYSIQTELTHFGLKTSICRCVQWIYKSMYDNNNVHNFISIFLLKTYFDIN